MDKSVALIQSGHLFPSAGEIATMKELGNMMVKSGFLPSSIKTPEQAIVIMLKGKELGLPPMQALSSIAVINGRPTMSAELMLVMIYKNIPGAVINFKVSNSEICTIEASRPKHDSSTWSFSIEDARKADLLGKGPWKTYPAAMLRARCITSMARAVFSDALSGIIYTPEELGAEVDVTGEVVPSKDVPSNTQYTSPVVLPKSVSASPVEPKTQPNATTWNCPGHLTSYTIPAGKFKGKRLWEVDPEDILKSVKLAQGEILSEAHRAVVDKMEDYCKYHGVLKTPEPTPFDLSDSGPLIAGDLEPGSMG